MFQRTLDEKVALKPIGEAEIYHSSASAFSPCCGSSQKTWTVEDTQLRQCHACGKFNGLGSLDLLDAIRSYVEGETNVDKNSK